jgi:hypothetical protein
MKPIPAIWRIDVEPDDFHSGPGLQAWNGFTTMGAIMTQLRPRLEDRSGAEVHPTWFPRFDPEIERAFGQTDFAVARYRPLIDEVLAQGDVFGIHVHYHRWDAQRRVTYSDHADVKWAMHCLEVAASTFERCFGEPVRRSSQGGYFLHNAVADRAIALGIEVDVTVEPGLAAQSADPSFGAYATAASSDFRNFPRRPYYPSCTALGEPASSGADTRPLLIVPLTAYDYETALASWPRRMARRLMLHPRRHLPLNPWKSWSHPRTYWDLVERAADEGPARYVALAVRTDGPDSPLHHRARAIMEYLPNHPISRRLRFVDPLSPEIRALACEGSGAEGT